MFNPAPRNSFEIRLRFLFQHLEILSRTRWNLAQYGKRCDHLWRAIKSHMHVRTSSKQAGPKYKGGSTSTTAHGQVDAHAMCRTKWFSVPLHCTRPAGMRESPSSVITYRPYSQRRPRHAIIDASTCTLRPPPRSAFPIQKPSPLLPSRSHLYINCHHLFIQISFFWYINMKINDVQEEWRI